MTTDANDHDVTTSDVAADAAPDVTASYPHGDRRGARPRRPCYRHRDPSFRDARRSDAAIRGGRAKGGQREHPHPSRHFHAARAQRRALQVADDVDLPRGERLGVHQSDRCAHRRDDGPRIPRLDP